MRFQCSLSCVLLIASGLGCREAATQPRGPQVAPNIAGIWTGTMSSGDKPSRPVTVEIQQMEGGSSVTGTIKTDCSGPQGCAEWELSVHIQGVFVEAPPWRIQGSATYEQVMSYPYLNYSAPLNGTIEGSPASRISATTSDFRSTHGGHTGAGALRLQVARSTP